MRKLLLIVLVLSLWGGSCYASDTLLLQKDGESGVMRREPRMPREPRPSGFGRRVSLGVSFGIGPAWLNPKTDSIYRNGPVLSMKYGIPIDINFNQKENYYFTTGVFFKHCGGKFHFCGQAYGADTLHRIIDRQYSAIYLTIPTGIKLKTSSINGFVVTANFGLYHSFRLTAKAFDKYHIFGEDVKTPKYIYTQETALFQEAGYIGLGVEYVVTDNFRIYFSAIYDHAFTNFFNPRLSNTLANGTKDRATQGNVEFQIGLCF